MTIDKAAARKLKELAEAVAESDRSAWHAAKDMREITGGGLEEYDSDYIAACDPKTILALLKENEALEARVKELVEAGDALKESCMQDSPHPRTRWDWRRTIIAAWQRAKEAADGK